MIIMTRKTIANGIASIYVPQYVTLKTGIYSSKPNEIEVNVVEGNTHKPPVFSTWSPMLGAKLTYRKNDKLVSTTLGSNKTTTVFTTGDWKVEVDDGD